MTPVATDDCVVVTRKTPEVTLRGNVGGDESLTFVMLCNRLSLIAERSRAGGIIIDVSDAFLDVSARGILNHLIQDLSREGKMLHLVVGEDPDLVKDMLRQFRGASLYRSIETARESAEKDTEAV